jgi:hypothetical protein
MNISDSNIEELFYQHFSNLDEETILEINKDSQSVDINNVVSGLQTHCMGIWLIDDIDEVKYQLFYVNGKKKLEGCYMQLSLDMKYKNHLTFFFSSFLADYYDDLDPVDIYNTFQDQIKSMLEKIGYMTVSVSELEKYEDPVLLPLGVRGLIKIQFLEKVEIYKELFCNKQQLAQTLPEGDYIYMALNKKNGYVKISKSKDLGFKLKTLQTSESDIELITYWQAPSQKEKELHTIFLENRKRDEWFDLKLKDLKTIKKYMQAYEMKGSSSSLKEYSLAHK